MFFQRLCREACPWLDMHYCAISLFCSVCYLTVPLFFEPHHPVKFAHVGESRYEEGLCSGP